MKEEAGAVSCVVPRVVQADRVVRCLGARRDKGARIAVGETDGGVRAVWRERYIK
jgi:hypothetical protein